MRERTGEAGAALPPALRSTLSLKCITLLHLHRHLNCSKYTLDNGGRSFSFYAQTRGLPTRADKPLVWTLGAFGPLVLTLEL